LNTSEDHEASIEDGIGSSGTPFSSCDCCNYFWRRCSAKHQNKCTVLCYVISEPGVLMNWRGCTHFRHNRC